MKYIFIFFTTIIISSFSNTAFSFDGVQELLEKNPKSKDFNIFSKVLVRCAGAYGALSKDLPGSESSMKNKLLTASIGFSQGALSAMRMLKIPPEEAFQFVSREQIYFLDKYTNYINRNGVNNWMKMEIALCSKFEEGINK